MERNPCYNMTLETEEQPSYIFKICLLGGGGVGKTCVARRLCFDTFDANTKLTIGLDFYIYDGIKIVIDGEESFIRHSLWDFGGQEQFKRLFSYYIHGANGIFMVFNLFNLNNTLLGLDWWYDQLTKFNHDDTPKILVGCKNDLVEENKVKTLIIENFRKRHDEVPFYRTSAKENQNIRKVFIEISKLILEKNNFEYDKVF